MRYFSQKEVFLGLAFFCWAGLLGWFFVFSDKTVGDILVNLITDVWFAVFVVLFIEYANNKDRAGRNRSRQRAIARSVQRFYQNIIGITQAMIADGVSTSPSVSMPTKEMVVERARSFSAISLVYGDVAEQPLPYAAYFLTEFRGSARANVVPERTTSVFIGQLASEVDGLYRDVFFLDNGFLPDEVVDALTALKNFHLFLLARNIVAMGPIRISFWTEDSLGEVVAHVAVLQRYFSPLLGYIANGPDEFLRDAIVNEMARKVR